MIVNAILNAGTNDIDASAALKSVIANPEVQKIYKSACLALRSKCLSCISIFTATADNNDCMSLHKWEKAWMNQG
jgi:hypothetical protein